MRVELLIASSPSGSRRQRGRRQLHRVHAHPRRLLKLRHQRRVGAAEPLRLEALLRPRARSSEGGAVIVTRLAAIEEMAGMNMLCFGKTTLTCNRVPTSFLFCFPSPLALLCG